MRHARVVAFCLAAMASVLLPAQQPPVSGDELLARCDAGELLDAELFAALADPHEMIAQLALGLLLHERAPWPDLALQPLSPRARDVLVGGLVERPRNEAVAWLLRLSSQPDLPGRTRLLALAALPPEQVTAAAVRDLLPPAGELPDDAMLLLASRLRPEIADTLVGQFAARLDAAAQPAPLLPLLERIGPAGERALARLLDRKDPATEVIAHWLASRKSPEFAQAVSAALAASAPLPLWALRWFGPEHLDPETRRRLVALLPDGGEPALLAFEGLVRCGMHSPALAAFALGAPDPRVRLSRVKTLLTMPGARIPDPLWLQLLDDEDPQVRSATMRALTQAPFSEAVELRLRQLATDSSSARRTLLVAGSRQAVAELWPRLRPEEQLELVPWLGHHGRSWVGGFLDGELAGLPAAGGARAGLREAILIARTQDGAPHARLELLSHLPELDAARLDRAVRALAPTLTAEDVPAVLTALGRTGDPSRRTQLVRLLAERAADVPEAWLQQQWQQEQELEVRAELVALQARSVRRRAISNELFAALVDGIDDLERELLFAWLGGIRPPLQAHEVVLLARLFATAARSGGDAPDRPARWFGRDGSALSLAVLDLLSRAPATDLAPFATELAAEEPDPALAAERSSLLLAAARQPMLRAPLGWPLAQAIAAGGPLPAQARGPVQLLLGEQAEARGDRDAALRAHRAALRALWQWRPAPTIFEAFLGVHDPRTGQVPLARLATQIALLEARAGDTEALMRARQYAAGDDEALRLVLEFDRRK